MFDTNLFLYVTYNKTHDKNFNSKITLKENMYRFLLIIRFDVFIVRRKNIDSKLFCVQKKNYITMIKTTLYYKT